MLVLLLLDQLRLGAVNLWAQSPKLARILPQRMLLQRQSKTEN